MSTTESVQSERLVMTVGEAAEALGISLSFAYELVAQNRLPALRLGRRVVIPVQRFRDFVAAGTTL